jgi:hypothetical protein
MAVCSGRRESSQEFVPKQIRELCDNLSASRAITRLASLSPGKIARMKTTDLTREQTERLLAEVTAMLGYLTRLSDRMDKRGMGTEPLNASVRKAQHAMQELRTSLHYLHCDGAFRAVFVVCQKTNWQTQTNTTRRCAGRGADLEKTGPANETQKARENDEGRIFSGCEMGGTGLEPVTSTV